MANRHAGEVLSAWFERIGHSELLKLLPLHNRLRFDPRGLDTEERAQLDQSVQRALQEIEQKYQVVGETD